MTTIGHKNLVGSAAADLVRPSPTLCDSSRSLPMGDGELAPRGGQEQLMNGAKNCAAHDQANWL
jgi:hypothetical protein